MNSHVGLPVFVTLVDLPCLQVCTCSCLTKSGDSMQGLNMIDANQESDVACLGTRPDVL